MRSWPILEALRYKNKFRLCFCIMLSFALENEDEKLAYPTMVIGILWTVGGSSWLTIFFLNFSHRDSENFSTRTNGLIRVKKILVTLVRPGYILTLYSKKLITTTSRPQKSIYGQFSEKLIKSQTAKSSKVLLFTMSSIFTKNERIVGKEPHFRN